MFDTALPKQKRRWLLLLILSAIVLRSPAFFNPIIDEDEAFYATAARVVNNGGLLYKNTVDLKPPLLFYFYAACFSIFGDDLRTLHGVTVIWALATPAIIGGIAKHLSKKNGKPLIWRRCCTFFSRPPLCHRRCRRTVRFS